MQCMKIESHLRVIHLFEELLTDEEGSRGGDTTEMEDRRNRYSLLTWDIKVY